MSATDNTSIGFYRDQLAEDFRKNVVRGSITAKKLKVFLSYRGDVDAWSRTEGSLTESEWRVIEKLVDDTFLVQGKLASLEFAQQHDERLSLACDSINTVAEVERIATKISSPTWLERLVQWSTGTKK